MWLGGGELQKVAGVPDLSLSVLPLGQWLATGTTSFMAWERVRGEIGCLGKASSQL